MRDTLQQALDKHIENIKWLQERLSNGHLTAEQVGIKLRSRSIELGTIACMPFRDQMPAEPEHQTCGPDCTTHFGM